MRGAAAQSRLSDLRFFLKTTKRFQPALPRRNHWRRTRRFRRSQILVPHSRHASHLRAARQAIRPKTTEARSCLNRDKALREAREEQNRAERSEETGRGSVVTPRSPRQTRSRQAGDDVWRGDSRMRRPGADGRRAGAKPRLLFKREGATRRTRPEMPNAVWFADDSGTDCAQTRRLRQDAAPTAYWCTPSGPTDAEIARIGAGVPLPRNRPHVGRAQAIQIEGHAPHFATSWAIWRMRRASSSVTQAGWDVSPARSASKSFAAQTSACRYSPFSFR